MRKYGMLLLVLVLATASLLAAAAYNTAMVANAATFSINNTNSALLAMVKTDTGLDDTVKFVGSPSATTMLLQPGVGSSGTMFGFQPKSQYNFNDLFKIINNSTDTVYVWYTLDGDLLTWYNLGYLKIGIETTPPNQILWKERNNPANGAGTYWEVMTVTGAGNWCGPVSLFFNVPDGLGIGSRSGNMYIHASRANPYGALPWHP